MVRGRTTSAACRAALYDALSKAGYDAVECMRTLPDSRLGADTLAVVRLSVCNMRSTGDFSAEMVSQALMGMPVRVLDYDGWYLIQTPDDYIAWVHPAAIERMDAGRMHEWNAAQKAVITSHYGFVHAEPRDDAPTVSDIVAGDRLLLKGRKGRFYEVEYPDGRKGYVALADAKPEAEWRASLRQDAAAITATAQRREICSSSGARPRPPRARGSYTSPYTSAAGGSYTRRATYVRTASTSGTNSSTATTSRGCSLPCAYSHT